MTFAPCECDHELDEHDERTSCTLCSCLYWVLHPDTAPADVVHPEIVIPEPDG